MPFFCAMRSCFLVIWLAYSLPHTSQKSGRDCNTELFLTVYSSTKHPWFCEKGSILNLFKKMGKGGYQTTYLEQLQRLSVNALRHEDNRQRYPYGQVDRLPQTLKSTKTKAKVLFICFIRIAGLYQILQEIVSRIRYMMSHCVNMF